MADTAARAGADDYNIHPQLACQLQAIAAVPMDLRRLGIQRLALQLGTDAVLELFGEFIGLANRVVHNASEHAQVLLIVEGGMYPHQAEKINMPCILGALNGIGLAAGIDVGPTCAGCAFRSGTIANQSLPTTLDAAECCEPGEAPFMCHEDLDRRGNATTGCRGFAQRRAAQNAAARNADQTEGGP